MTVAERLDAFLDEVTVSVPRAAHYRCIGSPYSTHVHKVGPGTGTFSFRSGEECRIQLVNWTSVQFVGDIDAMRAMRDQIILAVDLLENPVPGVELLPAQAHRVNEND